MNEEEYKQLAKLVGGIWRKEFLAKYGYLISYEDAQELIADTIVVYYEKKKAKKFVYKSIGGQWSYLRSILKYKILKFLEKKTEEYLSLNKPMNSKFKGPEDEYIKIFAVEFDPGQTVAINAAVNEFFQELSNMPEVQANMFLIKLIIGLKTSELAELLGRPAATVSTYISNVKRLLAKSFLKNCGCDVRDLNIRIYDVAKAALDKIDNREIKKAIELFFYEHYSVSKIAQALKLPEEEVDNLLMRGFSEIIKEGVKMRKLLKETVGEQLDDETDLLIALLREKLGVTLVTLGEYLEEFCEANKIKYEDFADCLDLSIIDFNKLLSDRLDVKDELLQRIARVTGVPLELIISLYNNSLERKKKEYLITRQEYDEKFYNGIVEKVKKKLDEKPS